MSSPIAYQARGAIISRNLVSLAPWMIRLSGLTACRSR